MSHFVRNSETKKQGQGFPFGQSLKYAVSGIVTAVKTERNVKIDLCFVALAVVLGFAFRIDAASWLAIAICCGVVLSLEIMNTAVEAVVDLVSPGYNELAKLAKDCAAGATLVSAISAVVVAAIIFLPRIGQLLWA